MIEHSDHSVRVAAFDDDGTNKLDFTVSNLTLDEAAEVAGHAIQAISLFFRDRRRKKESLETAAAEAKQLAQQNAERAGL